MTNLKKPQIVTILVAVVAIVLLFMLPRTEEGKVEESVASIEQSDDYRFAALEALNEADKNTYLALESKYSASSDPLNQIEKLDSMSHFWEEKGDLLMAADELFKAAEIISDVPSYMIAGDKYFEAFQNSQGERIELALNKSIKCYELILKKDSFKSAKKELMRLHGVGKWTAEYVSLRCLKDPAAFPVDDVGLQNAIKLQLRLSAKPSVAEIYKFSRHWENWEAYAAFYLWNSLM